MRETREKKTGNRPKRSLTNNSSPSDHFRDSRETPLPENPFVMLTVISETASTALSHIGLLNFLDRNDAQYNCDSWRSFPEHCQFLKN
jgi:hypothetical protein